LVLLITFAYKLMTRCMHRG